MFKFGRVYCRKEGKREKSEIENKIGREVKERREEKKMKNSEEGIKD
jgi:hypothetical protein